MKVTKFFVTLYYSFKMYYRARKMHNRQAALGFTKLYFGSMMR
jgi:hypothetical protein